MSQIQSKALRTHAVDNAASSSSEFPKDVEDLLPEILARIPARGVVQFRLVSPRYVSLPSDKRLIGRHLQFAAASEESYRLLEKPNNGSIRSMFLPLSRDSNFTAVSISSLGPESPSLGTGDEDLDIVNLGRPNTERFGLRPLAFEDSCNGLVLVREGDWDYYLWNPTIRVIKKLPFVDGDKKFRAHGFGFDAVIKEYKVVATCNRCDCGKNIMVYGVGQMWREVEGPARFGVRDGSGEKLNGAMHWLSYCKVGPSDAELNNILAFDLVKEEFREIVKPTFPCAKTPFAKLWVYRDCLSIVAQESFMHFYDVWVMKTYGAEDSWNLSFRISCIPFCGEPNLDFVWLQEKGLVLIQGSPLWALFDPKDESLHFTRRGRFKKGIKYLESLVSPYVVHE